MRRGPEEDDREGPERVEGEATGGRRPADQRRHRAGRAAQHDVLRRAGLEPERVDEDVAEQPGGRERGGQPVDGDPQLRHRDDAEGRPEEQSAPRLDPPARQRPAGRTGHAGVALPLDVVVDRSGAAGGQVSAEAGPEDGGERRATGVGDEHRRDAGEQQQGDDPRLGEGDVVVRDADRRAHRPGAGVAGSGGDLFVAGPAGGPGESPGTGAEVDAHAAAADASARGALSRDGFSLGNQASLNTMEITAAQSSVPVVRWATISGPCSPSQTLSAPRVN